MRINELISKIPGIEVIQDAEFNALGMATTNFEEEKVLSFLADIKFTDAVNANPNITAIVTTKEIFDNCNLRQDMGVVIVHQPKFMFFKIHNILTDLEFYWRQYENKISESAIISDSAFLDNHSITIGENVVIEPGVVIHSGTIIGDNVIIRSGCQIGTSGFQFFRTKNEVISVKTAGRTIIKDNVEIQHNCCVDRGVLGGDTILSKNVKVDNAVHIAHDDIIGENTFITAGVKLSGRVTIGKNCWIGVNATISNGISIGDNSKVTLGSVVTRNVDANKVVTGNFAVDHTKFIQFIKSIR